MLMLYIREEGGMHKHALSSQIMVRGRHDACRASLKSTVPRTQIVYMGGDAKAREEFWLICGCIDFLTLTVNAFLFQSPNGHSQGLWCTEKGRNMLENRQEIFVPA